MKTMQIHTSYVICAVQRSGSFLLCEVLKNTGLAGVPEEYFLYHPGGDNWEDHPWSRENGATTRREFVELVLEKGTTPNGVFGAKLMWNGFSQAVSAIQALPELSDLSPHSQLQSLFPNLHYIWIIREDRVRQAVSWAIAAQTGIYAAWQAEVQPALQEPAFDFEQIDLLYSLVLEGEAGWSDYFEANGIEPLKIVYEDLVTAYEATGFQVLDFLDVPYPKDLVFARERKMQKQATAINEEWAQKYRKMKGLAR